MILFDFLSAVAAASSPTINHSIAGRNLSSTANSVEEMDSIDLSADLTALPTNTATRLLSESPMVGTSSRSDLSSSQHLSVNDLSTGDLGQGEAEDDGRDEDEVEEDLRDEGEGVDEEAEIRKARKAARTREEKLQNDLFLLKKLNSAFSLYTDALRTTQSSTEVSGCCPPPAIGSYRRAGGFRG